MNTTLRAKLLSVAFGVAFGFLLGVFTDNFSQLSISKEVNLVEVGSFLLTLAATIVLLVWTDRHKYRDQLRKDAVRQALSDLRSSLLAVEQLLASSGSGIPTTELAARLKQYRQRRLALVRVLDRLGFRLDGEALNKFAHSQSLLHRLLTDTPKEGGEAGAELVVKGGAVRISDSRLATVHNQISSAEKIILEFEMDIILYTG